MQQTISAKLSFGFARGPLTPLSGAFGMAIANRTAKEYSRYGSTTHKQVYIYGGLDRGPTVSTLEVDIEVPNNFEQTKVQANRRVGAV